MTYGLTANGFTRKTLQEINAEIALAFEASPIFGETIITTADSALGQLISILAERESLLWELLQDLYDSLNPNNSVGLSLDNICNLLLIQRHPASYSTVPVTLTGLTGTIVPVGTRAAVIGTGDIFRSTTFQHFPVSGIINDTWTALNSGKVHAPLGKLSQKMSTVSGWTSIVNTADEELGDVIESDGDLRVRRLESLQVIGAGTTPALQSRLLDDVANVTDCLVIENETDSIDSEGRPPHSVHCIVRGGLDEAVASMIWEAKASGIQTYGSDLTVVTDNELNDHNIYYDRPQDLDIWMHVKLTVTADFNQGTKQVNIYGFTVANLFTYTIEINGVTYSYTSSAAATASEIVNGLINVINLAANMPIAPSIVGSTLKIESLYAGYEFASANGLNVTLDSTVSATGNQIDIANNIIVHSLIIQEIGKALLLHDYSTPINLTSGIWTLNAVLTGLTYPALGVVNISCLSYQQFKFDSSRITVEIDGTV